MTIWLCTFAILVFFFIAMSVGVFLMKKPIQGSCGGLNKLGFKEDCPVCGKKNRTQSCINTQDLVKTDTSTENI